MTKAQLDKLKKQREQLNARIQLLEAAEKTREKKRDTRRKILVGAWYMDKAKQEGTWDDLAQHLDTFLTRSSDRQLFQLDLSIQNNTGNGK